MCVMVMILAGLVCEKISNSSVSNKCAKDIKAGKGGNKAYLAPLSSSPNIQINISLPISIPPMRPASSQRRVSSRPTSRTVAQIHLLFVILISTVLVAGAARRRTARAAAARRTRILRSRLPLLRHEHVSRPHAVSGGSLRGGIRSVVVKVSGTTTSHWISRGEKTK